MCSKSSYPSNNSEYFDPYGSLLLAPVLANDQPKLAARRGAYQLYNHTVMPPRAQKRKLDDSPYALSGIKRTNLTSSSNGLYPREPRDRDASGYTNAAALSAGRGGDYYDKYSGLSSYERDPINPAQASKRRKVEAAGTNANTYYATGGGLPRGEEGPQITVGIIYLSFMFTQISFSSWIFRHCRIRLSSSISKCIISHRRSTPLQSRSNDLARRICFSSHPHRRNSNRLSKTLQVQHEPHQGQVHMDEFKDLAIGKNRNCRTRLNRRPSQPLRLPPR